MTQKTTRKRTRQESTETDDIDTENRFTILQEEDMEADYTAERAPSKEKRTRILPIILKNKEQQPATCANYCGGHPASYQGCPKFPKKSTLQKKLEPAMENQRPIQEISSPSPPPLARSFAKVVATPSAQIHTIPQCKQSSKEDSPPFLTRMLGNAANTRHPSTLKKLLAIAIDTLTNKDITDTFLNLLSEILTLLED
ncbi:hypothetical protein ILUMI_16988 [Ignelater luminosus]|uniref:Uncharacterized protein n=1 Tax=Ignelater luminosus TaxID=2038154 RepID=A0A8K0G2B7_IGNLU|nr:hypothetical protein ILUMI_16988 [Ignelater luminosus]